jgi:hypothetical protein
VSDEPTPMLYGLPGDEELDNDPGAVYERWECDHDVDDPEDRIPFAIEEFTAVRLGAMLAPGLVRSLLNGIGEDLYESEVSEGAADYIERAVGDPEVVAAFTSAVDTLRSRLNRGGWLQVDKHVRDIPVTWDDAGRPLLDGKPMYREATPS